MIESDAALPPSSPAASPFRFGPLVSHSSHMKEIFDLAAELASSHAGFLIEGEGGTGKQSLAREIHRRSAFSEGPFVVLRCDRADQRAWAAGASRSIEEAGGGTLYLEEVSEIPPHHIVELFCRQGGSVLDRRLCRAGQGPSADGRTPAIQILAATRVDLRALVGAGHFREDLYHRLAWLPLRIPPLRTRPEDIELLAEHFLARDARRGHRPPPRLRDDAKAALRARVFPGNVRELEQAMEYAAGVARGALIGADDLPPEVPAPVSLRAAARRWEEGAKGRIEAHDDEAAAAPLLGVPRSTRCRWRRVVGNG